MKKQITTLLTGLLFSAVSVGAFAHSGGGAGGGAMGGNPSVTKAQLEAKWNGKPGAQSTPIMGIVAHWNADANGKLVGKSKDDAYRAHR